MTSLRCLAVVACFVLTNAVSAQPIQVPVFQPPQKFPIFQPKIEIPAGTKFLAENVDTIGTIWIVLSAVGVLAVVGGIALKLLANSRRTNDPLQMALADPWMRAKIEAMSDQERAEFFGKKSNPLH